MREKRDSKDWWKKASTSDWKGALKAGKCLVGCDLEKHGNVCVHLYHHLLKTGNIQPFVAVNRITPDQHDTLTKPNEPKEVEFRNLLAPYVNDTNVLPGFITKYQQDILVLRFVYDMGLLSISEELGSSVNTVQVHLNKALLTLKPVIKKILKENE